MKMTFKGLLGAVGLAACLMGSALADDITFFVPTSPGGGIDNAVTGMTASLESSGFTVKKHFLKSCVDVMNATATAGKNAFMVVDVGAMIFNDPSKGSQCPPLDQAKIDVELVSSVYSTPVLLCSKPGSAIRDLDSMIAASKIRTLRIGSSAPLFTNVLNASASTSEVKYVVLPYSGGGTLKPAILAGDVDLYVNGSLPAALEPLGSKCFATSAKGVRNLPTFDEFFLKGKHRLPQVNYSSLMLAVKGTVTDDARVALVKAFKSAKFNDALTKMGTFHDGLGAGQTSEQQATQMRKVEQVYMLPYLK